jgi:hypothetical protein
MSARELNAREVIEIAALVAKVTAEAGLDVRGILGTVGMNLADVNLYWRPTELWGQVVRSLNQGISPVAGFGTDAAVSLLDAVAGQVPANPVVADLAARVRSLAAGPARTTAGDGVFLSYRTSARADVDQLFDALMVRGARVFQDYRCIAPGQRWADVIRDAAGTSSRFVAWVDATWTTSLWTAYEAGMAEARGARLIPLDVDGGMAAAPVWLSARQAISTRAPHDFGRLADAILR